MSIFDNTIYNNDMCWHHNRSNRIISFCIALCFLTISLISQEVFSENSNDRARVALTFIVSQQSIEWSGDRIVGIRDTTRSRIATFSRAAKLDPKGLVIPAHTMISLPVDQCESIKLYPLTSTIPSARYTFTRQTLITRIECLSNKQPHPQNMQAKQKPTNTSVSNTITPNAITPNTIVSNIPILTNNLWKPDFGIAPILQPVKPRAYMQLPDATVIVDQSWMIFSGLLYEPHELRQWVSMIQPRHSLVLSTMFKAWANQPIWFRDTQGKPAYADIYIPIEWLDANQRYAFSYSQDGEQRSVWWFANIISSGDTQRAHIRTDHCTYFAIAGVTGDLIVYQAPTPDQDAFLTDWTLQVSAILSGSTFSGVSWFWSGTSTSWFNTSLYDSGLRLMMNMDGTSIWWDTGSIAKDQSQWDLTATIGSAITWTGNGRYSGGYQFINNTNSRIDIINTGWLSFTWGYTMQAWIYPTRINGTQIIMWKQAGGNRDGYKMWVIAISANTWRLYTEIRSTNSALYNTSSTGYTQTVSLNQRFHVVGVYDDANNYMGTYINGQLSSYQPTTYSMTTPGWNFKLWQQPYNNNNRFQWVMDEVRLRNRALSSGEIQELYTMNLSKIATGQWQFISSKTGLTQTGYSYSLRIDKGADSYETVTRRVWTKKLSSNYLNPVTGGLSTWYDLMDSSSVILWAGSGIQTIIDKSGNGRNANQNTSNNQPLYLTITGSNPIALRKI